MSDKIEEIRERFTNGAPWTRTTLQDDIATLLAEGERLRAEIARLRADNERLRAALKPFAALSLWPDDIGDEWTVNDIRSGYDWDETENDTKTDDVFIKRGHIRAARKALEGSHE